MKTGEPQPWPEPAPPYFPPQREKGSGIMIASETEVTQHERIGEALVGVVDFFVRKGVSCVVPLPCEEERSGVVHVFLVKLDRAYAFWKCVDALLAAGEIRKAREALKSFAEICIPPSKRAKA